MNKKAYINLTLLLLSLVSLNIDVNSQNIEGYDKMIQELVQDEVPYMEIEDLSSKLNSEIYLLDTREEKEFQTSHIVNAIHVGYDNFKLKTIKDIPKDAIVITYCSVGYRSGQIGKRLLDKGYTNVFNLRGGLFSWANHDLPLVNDKGEETKEVHGYDNDWSKWINTNKCAVKLD